MNWPKALITELASRRCIVFLGSGASAGCVSQDNMKSPPIWSAFLQSLINLMADKTDLPTILDYKQKEKYLDAAEIIKKNISPADFSAFIREELVTPRYKPSKIHESILDIDPKIIITTNYDDIYDSFCRTGAAHEGYNVSKYYDSHIISDLRSPVRLIIKAHGCISDASQIVLTKSEYFRVRQKYASFYKVLDSLFLTHTILFLGYSLTDPDIQLVLENVNIAAPSAHPHYFVTGNNINPAIKLANKSAYNIEFIEYLAGNFEELNEGLIELSENVKEHRLSNPSV
ncbi:MAG: hypothetical protein JWR61_3753 [Ferruginibacter sp.]|uniref:SIR2 family protein n=1 Tax=Ferruginibacter sp. TaxID=1940288 RepID=UPI0026586690|nr:SIR2 family protein [Ferruginibacter sp.]MDB5278798.1 hypothetical protein [Ferruginibacter sp.]